MKVLLLCSSMREGIGKYFNRKEENVNGWISGTVTGLKNFNDISLSFAAFSKSEKSAIEKKEVDGVTYFCVSYENDLILNKISFSTLLFLKTKFSIFWIFSLFPL